MLKPLAVFLARLRLAFSVAVSGTVRSNELSGCWALARIMSSLYPLMAQAS
jgi:hypothetical protein